MSEENTVKVVLGLFALLAVIAICSAYVLGGGG